jgi:lysophospholipase L1-like esterase
MRMAGVLIHEVCSDGRGGVLWRAIPRHWRLLRALWCGAALLAAACGGPAALAAPVSLIGLRNGVPLALHEGREFPLTYSAEMARFAAEDARSPGVGEVLFTGSSSIVGWRTLKQDMAPLPVVNRAFGGSTSVQLWYYAERAVIARRPEIVVVYVGDNDLVQPTVSVENYLKYVRLFNREVSAALPHVRFVYLSNKPSPARWRFWPKFQQANQALRALCAADRRLTYVDITRTLLGPDGQVRPELFEEDQLHFRPVVYREWTRILKPVLERMWAEDPPRE